MTKPDAWIGAILVGVALAALIEAWSFASVPGMHFGAWTFPVFVSAALVVCGAALFLKALLEPAADGAAAQPPVTGQALAGFGIVCFAPVFYILAADAAGFLICAAIIVFALSWWFWRGLRRCALLAAIAAPVTEVIFAKGLMVPLPRGWLSFSELL